MSTRFGQGDPLPPRSKKTVYDLLICKPDQPLDLTILSPCWTGIMTHWTPGGAIGFGRTRLCSKVGECEFCASSVRNQYHVFFGVYMTPSRRRAVLSLTDLGIRSLEEAIPTNQDFRGQRIWVTRTTSHRSSMVQVALHEKKPPVQIPTAHDIWPTITAVYGPIAAEAVRTRISDKGGSK
jgi:hypothetical protein